MHLIGFHGRLFPMLFAILAALSWRPAVADFEEDFNDKKWQEVVVQLPAAPQQENLLPIYVSAATDNEFFVDGSTLTVTADGVVRYVLVVQTAGGARNVSFEGLRCETRERRIYASGRPDGSWSKSRNNEWRRILMWLPIAITPRSLAIIFARKASLSATSRRRAMRYGVAGIRKVVVSHHVCRTIHYRIRSCIAYCICHGTQSAPCSGR